MRMILVGLGGRGRSWAEVLRRQPGVEVVGYVEPDPGTRRLAQEQLELAPDLLFPLLDAALGTVTADAALDVTPPAAHEEVAIACFAAGLHLLQEKPMSDDFAAARRIVAAADAAGRTFMVTQNYRFAALPRTTRALLAAGRVGPLALGDMGFYRAWATRPGTHYTTMPFPLLTDMGIHHFDLLRYLLAEEPVRVDATSWNVPWGWHAGDAAHSVTIWFRGGTVVTHHANGASLGRQSPWHGDLRLEGPRGSLTWEDDRLFFSTAAPGQPPAREEIQLQPLAARGQDGLLEEFLAAVREGREPECSGRDNLGSLAIVFAAIASAQRGAPVNIDELTALAPRTQ
jgi:predicted dehydrogenase